MAEEERRSSKIGGIPYNGGTPASRQSDSDSDSAISSDESSQTDRHPLSGAGPKRTQLGKRPRRLLSRKTVNVLENTALIVALVMVIGLFTLPVIFYFKYAQPHQVSGSLLHTIVYYTSCIQFYSWNRTRLKLKAIKLYVHVHKSMLGIILFLYTLYQGFLKE